MLVMVAETATSLKGGNTGSTFPLVLAACIVFILVITASTVDPLVGSFRIWIYIGEKKTVQRQS